MKSYCDEQEAKDVREQLNEKGNEKYFYSISKTIQRRVLEQFIIMSKAEELGKKGEANFTEEDWEYVMTMGHGEYREYSLAKSRDRGYINYIRSIGLTGEKGDVHDGK